MGRSGHSGWGWIALETTTRTLNGISYKLALEIERQTSRPTSFMMTTRFLSVIVLRTSFGRFLGNPFDAVQLAYLKAPGMMPEIFTKPWG